jgi:hypothetical protein
MSKSANNSGPIGYNHPEAMKNREIMQKEINEKKVSIDRTCFSKTPEEKQELKLAKKAFKIRSNKH